MNNSRSIAIKYGPRRLSKSNIIVGSEILKHVLKPYNRELKASADHGVLIYDKKVAQSNPQSLKHTLKALQTAGWKIKSFGVNAGEQLKDWTEIQKLYATLLKLGVRRDWVVFAMGGGTVGDAVGFVASTYLRGLSWVSLPTTFLAQADSSIGGKTAINHALGKNLIGSFHQPVQVLCEQNYLKSLDHRDRVSGLAEIYKIGLLFDPFLVRTILKNPLNVADCKGSEFQSILTKAIRLKTQLIEQDEYDLSGQREALNLGHTFGHALEQLTHYRKFRHGEAVFWGLLYAQLLSHRRHGLALTTINNTQKLMTELAVPKLPKSIKYEHMLKTFELDKKFRNGRLHFVLLKKLGHWVSDSRVSIQDLQWAWKELKI